MNISKYVFSQLTSFLNRSQFNDYVRKYHGDHYVKHFTCWNQLLAHFFIFIRITCIIIITT